MGPRAGAVGHRAGDRDSRVGPDLLAELLLPLWVREAVGFFQFSELCVGGVVWCSLGSRWVTACARMSAQPVEGDGVAALVLAATERRHRGVDGGAARDAVGLEHLGVGPEALGLAEPRDHGFLGQLDRDDLVGRRLGGVDQALELTGDDARAVGRCVRGSRGFEPQHELGRIVDGVAVVVVARVGGLAEAGGFAGQLVAARLGLARHGADVRRADLDPLVVQVAGVGHAAQGLGVLGVGALEQGELVVQGRGVDQPVAALGVPRLDQVVELGQLHLGERAARAWGKCAGAVGATGSAALEQPIYQQAELAEDAVVAAQAVDGARVREDVGGEGGCADAQLDRGQLVAEPARELLGVDLDAVVEVGIDHHAGAQLGAQRGEIFGANARPGIDVGRVDAQGGIDLAAVLGAHRRGLAIRLAAGATPHRLLLRGEGVPLAVVLVARTDPDLALGVDPRRLRGGEYLEVELVGQVLRHREPVLSRLARDQPQPLARQALLVQVGRERAVIDRDVDAIEDEPERVWVGVHDHVEVAGPWLHPRCCVAQVPVVACEHDRARCAARFGGLGSFCRGLSSTGRRRGRSRVAGRVRVRL